MCTTQYIAFRLYDHSSLSSTFGGEPICEVYVCQRFQFVAMPKSRSRRAHARSPSVRSVSPDPISGHDTSESVRRSLVPVQLDKFWGDDGEDLDTWLFHVHAVSGLGHWTPAHRLQHATVALDERARAEYRAFLSTATAEGATWDRFEGFLRDQFGPKKPCMLFYA